MIDHDHVEVGGGLRPDQLVPSDGGPNWMGWFRVATPAPLELPSENGVYVLDEEAPDAPRYHFVPDG